VGKTKVHGVLFFGKQGRAKVIVEGQEEPISLAKGYSGTALHGDTVELIALPPKKRNLTVKKEESEKVNNDLKSEKLSNGELQNFLAI
jgi:hypothetical protein